MTSEEFEAALEMYRKEAHSGVQLLYAYLGMHAVLAGNARALEAVNRTPLFWRTIDGGLAAGFFIALGRVFDQDSRLNLDRLVKMAQDNLAIFSPDALALRKRRGANNADEWLPEFLQTAYVPSAKDFRETRKRVKKYRKIYDANYKPIRDKIFAHRELVADSDIQQAYAGTNIGELEELFGFLVHVYDVFRELLFNARKPEWNFEARCASEIVAQNLPRHDARALPERMVVEARELLEVLAR